METISRRQSFSEKGINVMSEKEKIIVFSSREICYQSSSFFANQMADAFEDLGFDVNLMNTMIWMRCFNRFTGRNTVCF